jgi:hypothetical protein
MTLVLMYSAPEYMIAMSDHRLTRGNQQSDHAIKSVVAPRSLWVFAGLAELGPGRKYTAEWIAEDLVHNSANSDFHDALWQMSLAIRLSNAYQQTRLPVRAGQRQHHALMVRAVLRDEGNARTVLTLSNAGIDQSEPPGAYFGRYVRRIPRESRWLMFGGDFHRPQFRDVRTQAEDRLAQMVRRQRLAVPRPDDVARIMGDCVYKASQIARRSSPNYVSPLAIYSVLQNDGAISSSVTRPRGLHAPSSTLDPIRGAYEVHPGLGWVLVGNHREQWQKG